MRGWIIGGVVLAGVIVAGVAIANASPAKSKTLPGPSPAPQTQWKWSQLNGDIGGVASGQFFVLTFRQGATPQAVAEYRASLTRQGFTLDKASPNINVMPSNDNPQDVQIYGQYTGPDYGRLALRDSQGVEVQRLWVLVPA